MDKLAAVHEDFGAGVGGRRAGLQREARNAGDGRQRFAAKAIRAKAVEIGRLGNFAGGVAFKGKQCIVADHAVAVVPDGNERAAASAKLDFDARGAGIEGVFDEFLHHRGRALDDLTSGDLVGNAVGKDADGRHRNSNKSRNRGKTEARNYITYESIWDVSLGSAGRDGPPGRP